MFAGAQITSTPGNMVRIHHLIQDVAQAIAGATLDDVFVTINRLVADAFGTRRTCIHLIDPTGISEDALMKAVGTCPAREARPEDLQTVMMSERYWNEQATRTTDHVTQWSSYRRFTEDSRTFEETFVFNEGIAVPLCYGAEVYGVLNIYLTAPVPVGHEELDLLLLLGPPALWSYPTGTAHPGG